MHIILSFLHVSLARASGEFYGCPTVVPWKSHGDPWATNKKYARPAPSPSPGWVSQGIAIGVPWAIHSPTSTTHGIPPFSSCPRRESCRGWMGYPWDRHGSPMGNPWAATKNLWETPPPHPSGFCLLTGVLAGSVSTRPTIGWRTLSAILRNVQLVPIRASMTTRPSTIFCFTSRRTPYEKARRSTRNAFDSV